MGESRTARVFWIGLGIFLSCSVLVGYSILLLRAF